MTAPFLPLHDNMTQLARLAIKPLRIAFDDIKLKDILTALPSGLRTGMELKRFSTIFSLITRISLRISMSG